MKSTHKRCSAFPILTLFLASVLFTPATVQAGKAQKTAIVASGSTTVPANFQYASLVTDLDVSDFRTVRILLRVYNAMCTSQNVTIFFDGYISPESPGDLHDCGNPSILFDTAGTKLTLIWLNKDPANDAIVSYEVLGRK